MGKGDPTPRLTPFQRIEIQMEAIVPLVRELQQVLGEQVVLDALRQSVRREIEAAEALPRREPDFDAIRAAMGRYAEGDALAYQVLEQSPDHLAIDVTRCGYAELMDRLDARDLGDALICSHDHAATLQGGAQLERTQTCMQGASHCDFRFRRRPGTDVPSSGTSG